MKIILGNNTPMNKSLTNSEITDLVEKLVDNQEKISHNQNIIQDHIVTTVHHVELAKAIQSNHITYMITATIVASMCFAIGVVSIMNSLTILAICSFSAVIISLLLILKNYKG